MDSPMSLPPRFQAIGLMSGTSIDGIDAALLETDGLDFVRPIAFTAHPYAPAFRTQLRRHLGNRSGVADPAVAAFEKELTDLHAEIVQDLLLKTKKKPEKIDLIGFHGQTLWHRPEERITIQIGDGALLAKKTGIPVINDFRTADVRAGGHGAPLVPLYHRALGVKLPKPAAILNIGGVSNVTYIGGVAEEDLLAYDVGPGNAMIDDWVFRHTGKPYDESGQMAASGRVDEGVVARALAMPFFAEKPPKSLDRDAFNKLIPEQLPPPDGAATLTMITARGVAEGMKFMPQKPQKLYVTGGGRLNRTLMLWMEALIGIPVASVDDIGWNGDGLEAEAFAYLAVRSHLGLPLSVPGTTGVPRPLTGGRAWRP